MKFPHCGLRFVKYSNIPCKILVLPHWAGKCNILQIFGFSAIKCKTSSGKSFGCGDVNLTLTSWSISDTLCSKSANLKIVHSVEISWFFYHSDLTWNQFMRFWKCKICHFNTFRGSEFWFLWICAHFDGWNYQINNIQSPYNCKKGSLRTSRVSEIDFT